MDQKISYHKMNDILIQLNNLIFDILEPPSYPFISEDLSLPILPIKRHIDIIDTTLDTSILLINMIRFYIHKAKKDPYYTDFKHVILDEINQLIEKY